MIVQDPPNALSGGLLRFGIEKLVGRPPDELLLVFCGAEPRRGLVDEYVPPVLLDRIASGDNSASAR